MASALTIDLSWLAGALRAVLVGVGIILILVGTVDLLRR